MITVYSAPNITMVSIFRSILEGHGIACRVKNEFISAGVGDIPPIECWPQLCVEEKDLPEAERIVAEALAPDRESFGTWKCQACGEEVEGQFSHCWKCGKAMAAGD
jgi:hypothetical protein